MSLEQNNEPASLFGFTSPYPLYANRYPLVDETSQ